MSLLGFLFGRVKLLGDIFNPYITLFNGIPKVALAPVFVIWFGIGLMSKIAIILTMVFFVVFINTFAGLRSVNEEYVSIVRIMGASSLQVIREVFLPATLPVHSGRLARGHSFFRHRRRRRRVHRGNQRVGLLHQLSPGNF